jgi:hypothetical protein
MQTIEIFRAGTHQAVNGKSFTLSTADLASCAAAYDPGLHEAPLVVGHPKLDDPAYGWVKGLAIEGDRLVAKPDQVDAAFSDLVQSGRFKHRSASFYPPEHPSNPTPGKWYLKHVGFLGATPPAVKGLKPVQFAEDPEAVEFADWTALTAARLFGRLRDFLIAQFGQDKADIVLPADDIDQLKFDAAQPDPEPDSDDTISSYGDPSPMITPTKEELEARERKLASEEAAFAERQKAARRGEIAIFVDGLVTAGRVSPGHKAGLAAFMEKIPDGDDGAVEFAEAGNTVKTEAGAWFRGFLGKLPKLVETREVAPHGNAAATIDFADAVSIDAAAAKYQADQAAIGRNVSAAEAVSFVMKGARK